MPLFLQKNSGKLSTGGRNCTGRKGHSEAYRGNSEGVHRGGQKEIIEEESDALFHLIIRTTKIVKKTLPPDTSAAFIWLKNRRPQAWRDKQIIENVGKDEGPIWVAAPHMATSIADWERQVAEAAEERENREANNW